LGYSPAELFRCGDFLSVLSEEQAENLLEHIEYAQDDLSPQVEGPDVFSLIVTGPDSVEIKLWCAVHVASENPKLFVCEFELQEDYKFPLCSTDDGIGIPKNTLDSMPTQEELVESTLSVSKPIRVLKRARKQRGEAAAMEVYNIMSQIQGMSLLCIFCIFGFTLQVNI
jgi:hypothetical protein